MGWAVFGLRLEKRVDGLDQRGRCVRRDALQGFPLAVARVVERLKVVAPVEGAKTSEALVEQDAE